MDRLLALSPPPKLQPPHPIIIYDTTLRDGEQMAGVRFDLQAKLEIARALDGIHVHQIEAGFPVVSAQELQAVRAVAQAGLSADILALARPLPQDLEACQQAEVDVALLFISASDIMLQHKLHLNEDEVAAKVAEACDLARSLGLRFTFTPEDSTRSPWPRMARLLTLALERGAERVGIADTNGVGTPPQVAALVRSIRSLTDRPISLHLHNDFGLALANALAGIEAGASAVNTTVNGIGERAGNIPFEQVVATLSLLYDYDLGIDLRGLKGVCDLVARHAGVPQALSQPLVGANAFAHESGIHVAAVVEAPRTYEAIEPSLIGHQRRIIFGKHTGRAAVRWLAQRHCLTVTEDRVAAVTAAVKDLGAREGTVDEKTVARWLTHGPPRPPATDAPTVRAHAY